MPQTHPRYNRCYVRHDEPAPGTSSPSVAALRASPDELRRAFQGRRRGGDYPTDACHGSVATYPYELHEPRPDHPQFEWQFQRQLYDALHDYFVEMFIRTPQDRND